MVARLRPSPVTAVLASRAHPAMTATPSERPVMPRLLRYVWPSSGQDHSAGLASRRSNEHVTFPPFPCDRGPVAGHRCEICHRAVAYRSGSLSEVLTEHYRQTHPQRSASRPRSLAGCPHHPPGTITRRRSRRTLTQGEYRTAGTLVASARSARMSPLGSLMRPDRPGWVRLCGGALASWLREVMLSAFGGSFARCAQLDPRAFGERLGAG
jgi:hypothetical protein